jgi:hypothetical protein
MERSPAAERKAIKGRGGGETERGKEKKEKKKISR